MKTLKRIHTDESGLMLIEVLVSSILLVVVSIGVFKGFDAATRSSAEERHRAQAHTLAEADLSRMRGMRISDLSNLNETSTFTQDGVTYTINSRGDFQTDATGTASCEEGTASADYILVSSTVTWASIGSRPPVVASTLVAPPNGSVSANSGALAIAVEDSQNLGIPGVTVTGSGAASFSGTTGPTGCFIVGNLPAGNYTLNVAGVASGLVDVNGDPPGPVDTSVVGESTNTVVLQYDNPGSVVVSFTTKPYGGGAVVPSSADSIVAFNTGMTAARAFPPTPGARVASITADQLFPFTSDYAIYAGTCEGDDPNSLANNPNQLDPAPGEQAILSALVPPGGSPAPPTTIQLPALHMTVYTGTTTGSLRAAGATVRLRDLNCADFQRTLTTNLSGQFADPGLPFTDYQACVHDPITNQHKNINLISLNDVNEFTGGTVTNVFMGSGTSPGSCPP
jgi:Tfp pilus assembly protein PilV